MGVAKYDILPGGRGYRSGIEALSRPSEDMLEFRREFVIKMGWFDEAHRDDNDRYDATLSTVHFVNRDDDGEILSGMRLTKLGSLEQSLSVEMLHSNQRMHEAALVLDAAFGKDSPDMWDLTRLVHRLDGEPRFGKSIASTLEVFGAGLAKTMPDDDHDLVWLFTTTESMKALLDDSGIKADVITRGKIAAHDEQDSYFCVIHPISAMQFLRDNQTKFGATYQIVNSGFEEVVG